MKSYNGTRIIPSRNFIKKYKLSDNFLLEITDVIHFTSERKIMSVVIYENDGHHTLLTKGAPEMME